MSDVLVSINFATIREGWLPNTFRALGQQTMPKNLFEFVIVDDWGDRWDLVRSLAEEHRVNVKYMKSKPWHWKSNRQLGNARNTGFIHCEGEIVVFLDDYSWVEPAFLATHWDLYRTRERAVIGVVQAVEPEHGNVFSKANLQIVKKDRDERWKNIYPQHEKDDCNAGWFWTFNASAPMKSIVRVNGYDERYDCLPGNTPIITSEGVKDLSKIKVGDRVLTHLGRFMKTTHIQKSRFDGNLISITPYSSNIPVLLTPNHLVRVIPRRYKTDYPSRWKHELEREWVRAEDVKRGDLVVLPVPVGYVENALIDLSHFDTGPELIVEENYVYYRKNPKRVHNRFIKVDKSLATLMGYYIAEGNSGRITTELTFSKDEENYARQVQSLFKDIFNINASVVLREGKSRGKPTKTFYVAACSKIVSSMLSEKCGSKSHSKRIPSEVLFGPIDVLKSLLDAYFNGDANRRKAHGKYDETRATTVSSKLGYELRLAVLRCGWKPRISKRTRSSGFSFEKARVSYILSFSNTPKKHGGNKMWIRDGDYLCRVRKKGSVKWSGELRNLTVDTVHSYSTPMFSVHNCAGEDDVDLGLRLARIGVKFLYTADPKIKVYHMKHNGGQSRPSPFPVEECHKFTKEMLNVKYDGSWGLMEDNARRKPWEVNQGYFNLKEARTRGGEYPRRRYVI